MIKEANIDELALLLAISNSRAGGGGSVTESQVKGVVEEYLAKHTATEDAAGVIKIGSGIKVDEEGVASIDEEMLTSMVADLLEQLTVEITDDEINSLWGNG
jgi:hypothetical protein